MESMPVAWWQPTAASWRKIHMIDEKTLESSGRVEVTQQQPCYRDCSPETLPCLARTLETEFPIPIRNR